MHLPSTLKQTPGGEPRAHFCLLRYLSLSERSSQVAQAGLKLDVEQKVILISCLLPTSTGIRGMHRPPSKLSLTGHMASAQSNTGLKAAKFTLPDPGQYKPSLWFVNKNHLSDQERSWQYLVEDNRAIIRPCGQPDLDGLPLTSIQQASTLLPSKNPISPPPYMTFKVTSRPASSLSPQTT